MPSTITLQPTGQALTVPTKWADVTLAQFLALYAAESTDSRRPAEVLCGLEAGGLDDLAADDVKYLSNLLTYAQDPTDVLALLPTPGLPDIGSLPFGTMLLAQQYVQTNSERPALTHAPFLCALYRIQLAYGKYDAGKVEACLEALLASAVTEVYADCSFFLTSYQRWSSATPPTPTTTPSLVTRKSRRGANGSRIGSGRFSAWIRRLAAPS
jgi:hypothetical protein